MLEVLSEPDGIVLGEIEAMSEISSKSIMKVDSILLWYIRSTPDVCLQSITSQGDGSSDSHCLVDRGEVVEALGATVNQLPCSTFIYAGLFASKPPEVFRVSTLPQILYQLTEPSIHDGLVLYVAKLIYPC